MEKSKLDKLTAALFDLGYNVKSAVIEQKRNKGHPPWGMDESVRPYYEQTGDILLRISPKEDALSDQHCGRCSGAMVLSGSGNPQKI
jgi:hypothetical protein